MDKFEKWKDGLPGAALQKIPMNVCVYTEIELRQAWQESAKQIVDEIRELPVPEMKKGTSEEWKETFGIEWRMWCKIIASCIKKDSK